MDSGSGWLVSQSGLWVPVAYNASVSKGLSWERSSFTSLGGVRRTASRGRAPRTWEVKEKVIAEWAQALDDLWDSEDSTSPMYWVPPMDYITNYARRAKTPQGDRQTLRVDSEGVGVGFSWASGNYTILTGDTPVQTGVKIEVGAKSPDGQLTLVVLDSTFAIKTTLGPANFKKGADGFYRATFTPTDPTHTYVRLIGTLASTDATSPFIRKYTSLYGARTTGSGGGWVTLDDVSLDHDAIGFHHALVTVSFSLTECEMK